MKAICGHATDNSKYQISFFFFYVFIFLYFKFLNKNFRLRHYMDREEGIFWFFTFLKKPIIDCC